MNVSDSIQQDLLTVRDWVRWGATQFGQAELFFGHGTDNPWDEAIQLVLWAIRIPWERLDHVIDTRLTRSEKQQILALYQQRIEQRIPAPYITGVAHFAGLEFKVTRDVLIPRSPIAELIQQGFEPWLCEEPMRILDLCTGCGCIGIACAVAFPGAVVDLSDISPQALQVANDNILRHQLQDQVSTIESDLFANITHTYDLIVSNPPYVDADDMANLPVEFLLEPRLALESGVDGLDFTRRLLREAEHFLNDNGLLVIEVGNSWAALEEAFPSVPFTWIELEQGGHGVFVITKAQLMEHRASFQ
jgi:ribosomal protein L3 glutamine methyltransferase